MNNYHYVEISDVVSSLPQITNPIYSAKIEIDTFLMIEVSIESEATNKVRKNIGISNIPSTHYVEFVGIK